MPRWRTMIEPAVTVWPSPALMPSRWPTLSRPFLTLPPAFLCAIWAYSLFLDLGAAFFAAPLSVVSALAALLVVVFVDALAAGLAAGFVAVFAAGFVAFASLFASAFAGAFSDLAGFASAASFAASAASCSACFFAAS